MDPKSLCGRRCLTKFFQPNFLSKLTSRSMYLPNSGGNCVFGFFTTLSQDRTGVLLALVGTGTDGSGDGMVGSVVVEL